MRSYEAANKCIRKIRARRKGQPKKRSKGRLNNKKERGYVPSIMKGTFERCFETKLGIGSHSISLLFYMCSLFSYNSCSELLIKNVDCVCFLCIGTERFRLFISFYFLEYICELLNGSINFVACLVYYFSFLVVCVFFVLEPRYSNYDLLLLLRIYVNSSCMLDGSIYCK